nr:RING finger protein 186 [Pogona vitticeps]
MEGSTDRLHTETETGAPVHGESQREKAEEDPGRTDGSEPLESPQSPATQMDNGPECETCSIEKPQHFPAREDLPPEAGGAGLSVSPKPPDLDPGEPSEGFAVGAEVPPRQTRLSKASLAEMDCLVCFNRYSPCRPPKVLACQHAFCAVCLKLLLRHEDRTWVITCPLCRKATVVFGGLVCSLRDKEEVVGRLEGLALEVEEACPPPDLPGESPADPPSVSGNDEEAVGMTSRAAAKRLVLLLLLVAVLIVLVLPFLYTGLLKWALCALVLLGLILSMVLCCNPRWGCSGSDVCSWQRKESQVATIA